MTASSVQGFYGKLPVLGDFVTRRLPKSFIAAWDQWLQSCLASSREQLGDDWLEAYLFSPIWRFGLSPGLCGEQAWAGVLMPSVDKVNRHFPLTFAFSVPEPENLPYLFGTTEGGAWFAELEKLALDCLDSLSVDSVDERLCAIRPPSFAPACQALPWQIGGAESNRARQAFHIGMASPSEKSGLFTELAGALLTRWLPLHSYWSPLSSENIPPALLVCEGLPPIDAYVALLTGDFAQRGWSVNGRAVRSATGHYESPPAIACVDAHNGAPFFEQDAVTRPRKKQQQGHWVWRSWGLSVVGKRRKLNEDALLDRCGIGLWVVADGMGGHHAGDVASQMIVKALSEIEATAVLPEFADRVDRSLQGVNAKLCRLAADSGLDNTIIGSTVEVLLAAGNQCLFLWAGDSRLYRYRGSSLEQLTQDHSLYDDFIREGLVSLDTIGESGRCNIITRAVGAGEALQLSRGECLAQDGDIYLLCSDGLDKELTKVEIESILREYPAEDAAKILIESAEDKGARDNVTVMAIAVKLTQDGG